MQGVFEKIIKKLEEELNLADEEKLRCARENALQFDSAKGYAHGVGKAIEIVKQEATEHNNGWIPCSERLPSEADFIASYRRNKYSAEFVVMIEGATRPTTLYFRKTGSWVDENENLYKVTAWQPLPEPYKGE